MRNDTSGLLELTGTIFHGDKIENRTVVMSGAYAVITFETNVYVVSDTSAAVACFRQTTAGLSYLDTVKPPANMCDGPRSIVVTSDGLHAYVACGQ